MELRFKFCLRNWPARDSSQLLTLSRNFHVACTRKLYRCARSLGELRLLRVWAEVFYSINLHLFIANIYYPKINIYDKDFCPRQTRLVCVGSPQTLSLSSGLVRRRLARTRREESFWIKIPWMLVLRNYDVYFVLRLRGVEGEDGSGEWRIW